MNGNISEPIAGAGSEAMESMAALAQDPIELTVDRIVGRVAILVTVLDEEAVAAREGRSTALRVCFERKLELTRLLETDEALLREAVRNGDKPSDRQVRRLIDSDLALNAALARNEQGLRGASEGVRRIFEGAARVLASEDIGYGPARLTGEAGIFDSRAV